MTQKKFIWLACRAQRHPSETSACATSTTYISHQLLSSYENICRGVVLIRTPPQHHATGLRDNAAVYSLGVIRK